MQGHELIIEGHIGWGFTHGVEEDVFGDSPEMGDGGRVEGHAHQAHNEKAGHRQADATANKGH